MRRDLEGGSPLRVQSGELGAASGRLTRGSGATGSPWAAGSPGGIPPDGRSGYNDEFTAAWRSVRRGAGVR